MHFIKALGLDEAPKRRIRYWMFGICGCDQETAWAEADLRGELFLFFPFVNREEISSRRKKGAPSRWLIHTPGVWRATSNLKCISLVKPLLICSYILANSVFLRIRDWQASVPSCVSGVHNRSVLSSWFCRFFFPPSEQPNYFAAIILFCFAAACEIQSVIGSWCPSQ